MKVHGSALAFVASMSVLVLIACGCGTGKDPNTPSTDRTQTQEGLQSDRAEQQQKPAAVISTRRFALLVPSPYIADGRSSVMSPSDTLSTRLFYGTFWGDPQDDPQLVEQCFLGKETTPLSGLTLVKFPDTLPMAEDTKDPTIVYWHFAKNPDGSTPPDQKFADFYNHMKTISNGHDSQFLYGVSAAYNHKGPPPEPDTASLSKTAKGIAEHFSIPETGCEGSVFALPFTVVGDSQKPQFPLAERQRRILQARKKECGELKGKDVEGKVAKIDKVEPMEYGAWYTSVSPWGAEMTYTDGLLFIDDTFPSVKVDLKAFREASRVLLGQ